MNTMFSRDRNGEAKAAAYRAAVDLAVDLYRTVDAITDSAGEAVAIDFRTKAIDAVLDVVAGVAAYHPKVAEEAYRSAVRRLDEAPALLDVAVGLGVIDKEKAAAMREAFSDIKRSTGELLRAAIAERVAFNQTAAARRVNGKGGQ